MLYPSPRIGKLVKTVLSLYVFQAVFCEDPRASTVVPIFKWSHNGQIDTGTTCYLWGLGCFELLGTTLHMAILGLLVTKDHKMRIGNCVILK